MDDLNIYFKTILYRLYSHINGYVSNYSGNSENGEDR